MNNSDTNKAQQLRENVVITGALISMTDFIEKVRDLIIEKAPLKKNKALEYFDLVFNYSDFLKTKLELGMFFPFDNDGNFMIEPKAENYFNVNVQIDKLTDEDKTGLDKFYSDTMYYDDAMKKVLFKGFIIENGYIQANRDTLYLNNQDGLDIASKNENNDKNFIWDVGFKTIEDLIPYNIELTDVAIKRIFG